MILDAYIHLPYLTSFAQKIVTVLLIAVLIIYELSGENKTYGKKLLIPFIVVLGIAVLIIIIQSVI